MFQSHGVYGIGYPRWTGSFFRRIPRFTAFGVPRDSTVGARCENGPPVPSVLPCNAERENGAAPPEEFASPTMDTLLHESSRNVDYLSAKCARPTRMQELAERGLEMLGAFCLPASPAWSSYGLWTGGAAVHRLEGLFCLQCFAMLFQARCGATLLLGRCSRCG